MERIYNPSSVNLLLGCLLQDTSLIESTKYPLDKEDFCVAYQKYIFVAIYNLYKKGNKSLRYMDLDNYLSKRTEIYQVFKDCGGRGNIEDYIETITDLASIDNYESYYNDVRKMSVIRDYKDSGHNIDKFFDYNKSDEDNLRELDGVIVEDIIKHYEILQTKMNHKYKNSKVKEEYIAGTDFMKTKEECKSTPMLGNSFQSECLNGIFRGMYGFIIRVAKSGGGKSVLSLADLCKTCILEYWDFEKNKFVKNESRVGAGLFINTELDLRKQLDIATISWISGVERSHIANGCYLDGEEDRVDYASNILLRSELYFVDDPHFTCSSLSETISYYAKTKNVLTVCFDYISDNIFAGREIANETKVAQRQDMILLELTARLKQIQLENDICLISACQTNGKEDTLEYPTSSCMAGGQSQERKTDGVLFMLPPTKKELEATAPILASVNNKNKFKVGLIPNNVCHIIKGRNSEYEKNIKIFQYMDLSTLRTIDLYATDKYNQPIKIEPLKIVANN